MKTWCAYVSCAIVLLVHGRSLGQTFDGRVSERSQDSISGKPSFSSDKDPTSAGNETVQVSWAVPNSSYGKKPSSVWSTAVPPQLSGPGLRFDTHRLFYVYTDEKASANHFAPSGWMGDVEDIRFDDRSTDGPADGKTCMKVTYLARGSRGYEWAGMFWQNPDNNWGQINGGYNLRGMKRLTFWARGEKGGETIALFKVGGIEGDYPDTDAIQIGPVVLTREWRQYYIDLSDAHLEHISGGFCWAIGRRDNPGPVTFFLDEIRYER